MKALVTIFLVLFAQGALAQPDFREAHRRAYDCLQSLRSYTGEALGTNSAVIPANGIGAFYWLSADGMRLLTGVPDNVMETGGHFTIQRRAAEPLPVTISINSGMVREASDQRQGAIIHLRDVVHPAPRAVAQALRTEMERTFTRTRADQMTIGRTTMMCAGVPELHRILPTEWLQAMNAYILSQPSIQMVPDHGFHNHPGLNNIYPGTQTIPQGQGAANR